MFNILCNHRFFRGNRIHSRWIYQKLQAWTVAWHKVISWFLQQELEIAIDGQHQFDSISIITLNLPESIQPYPIGSMVLLYGNIYHQYTPNVSIYTHRIHVWYIYANMTGVYWWDPWHTIYSSTMDPSWDCIYLKASKHTKNTMKWSLFKSGHSHNSHFSQLAHPRRAWRFLAQIGEDCWSWTRRNETETKKCWVSVVFFVEKLWMLNNFQRRLETGVLWQNGITPRTGN